MSNTTTTNNKNNKKRNILIVTGIIAAIIVAAVIFFCVTLSKAGSDGVILQGVKIEGIEVGGMTKDQALEKLTSELPAALKQQTLNVKFGDNTLEINKMDITKSIDYEVCVSSAVSVGRDGNIFARFFEIMDTQSDGKDLNASIVPKKARLKKLIKPFVKNINDDVVNFSYDVDYELGKMTLYSGKKIEGLDLQQTIDAVGNALNDHKDSVELTGITIAPSSIPYKKLLKKVNSSGKNATIKVLEGGKDFEYVDSVDKIEVDVDQLKAAYDSLVGADDTSVTIDVIAEPADITLDDLKDNMFKDKLATYTTTFSTATTTNMNRRTNMQLASKSINNYILAPGDVFSFNDICGPRNESTGYKIAGAYRDGQSTQEYGGGICQCSTTLYNAVLRADMQVVYRKNHTFDVAYVPKGLDATVSHPEVDFKWKNNYNYPVKVKASVASNSITVSLYGTIEDKSKEVIISSEILETRPMKTEYKYSPNYPKNGVQLSSGHNGYIARSYKTIKRDGKVVSKTTIATSYYSMMKRVVGKQKDPKADKQDKKDKDTKKKD